MIKVKELIEKLSQMNQESEVFVSVYDCGGFNDAYSLEDINSLNDKDNNQVMLEISVGCDTHKRWVSNSNCPIEKIQEELNKAEAMINNIEYYKKEITRMTKKLSDRNKKE